MLNEFKNEDEMHKVLNFWEGKALKIMTPDGPFDLDYEMKINDMDITFIPEGLTYNTNLTVNEIFIYIKILDGGYKNSILEIFAYIAKFDEDETFASVLTNKQTHLALMGLEKKGYIEVIESCEQPDEVIVI